MEITRNLVQKNFGIEKCNISYNPLTSLTTITVDCAPRTEAAVVTFRLLIVLSPKSGRVALQELVGGSWRTRIEVCTVPWKVRSRKQLLTLARKNLAPHIKGLLEVFKTNSTKVMKDGGQ